MADATSPFDDGFQLSSPLVAAGGASQHWPTPSWVIERLWAVGERWGWWQGCTSVLDPACGEGQILSTLRPRGTCRSSTRWAAALRCSQGCRLTSCTCLAGPNSAPSAPTRSAAPGTAGLARAGLARAATCGRLPDAPEPPYSPRARGKPRGGGLGAEGERCSWVPI